MTRVEWVIEKASRPEGVSSTELAEAFDIPGHKASTFLSKRMNAAVSPLLCARQLGHKARYFIHAADLDAYVKATPSIRWDAPERQAEYNRRKTAARRIARASGGGRARRRPSDPVARGIKKQVSDVPVDYSRAVLTVCPSPTHDARYQVAPGERVFGAGFAAIGQGRDVTTGKVWGRK